MIEENHIYNMDCLSGLKEMIKQRTFVDCVIADPPYFKNYKTNRRRCNMNRFCKPIIGDDNPQLLIDLLPLLSQVMKDNTPLYLFCSSEKVDFFKQEIEKHFKFKNIIVWDKGNHTAGDLEAQYGKRYEMLIYANKGRAKFNSESPRYDDIWHFARVAGSEQIHQNQKPVPLLSRIILQHTKTADLILDPFMGSCATAVAAHNLQRKYIGFELDKGYFRDGTKWLKSVCSQISLFEFGGDADG